MVQRLPNVSPDFAVDIVKAWVVLYNFVSNRDDYKIEVAMTVTGMNMYLMDNQYVGWGWESVNSEQCNEWSSWWFSNRFWSCSLANVKNMNSRVFYLQIQEHKNNKKNKNYYNAVQTYSSQWDPTSEAYAQQLYLVISIVS
jgi:hypothetical protein